MASQHCDVGPAIVDVEQRKMFNNFSKVADRSYCIKGSTEVEGYSSPTKQLNVLSCLDKFYLNKLDYFFKSKGYIKIIRHLMMFFKYSPTKCRIEICQK